jgi:hypothetical protein
MLWRNLSALRRRRLLNLQAHADVAALLGDLAYSRKAMRIYWRFNPNARPWNLW